MITVNFVPFIGYCLLVKWFSIINTVQHALCYKYHIVGVFKEFMIHGWEFNHEIFTYLQKMSLSANLNINVA